MQLEINSNNEIIAYLIYGGIDGIKLVEYGGAIPDNFEENFKPSFYLLKNNEIVINPNYVELIPSRPDAGPTAEQLMINQLGLQVATLTAEVNQLKGGVSNV